MYRNDWSKASLIEVVKYIERHHCQIKAKLLKLPTLLEHAANLHKDEYGGIISSLQEFLPVFKTELENHFDREEHLLIPYIRQMNEFDKNRGVKPEFHSGSIKNPISQLEYDHSQTENVMFGKICDITGNYQLPQNAGDAIKALYDGLKDIQTILGEHIHIENNVLFPLAIKLELELMHKK